MEQFFEINAALPDQSRIIPDRFFDCLILSHVLEHTPNSEKVLNILLGKFKKGGIIYVEFPNPHSVYRPSMKSRKFFEGTLNFYDDPNHVRVLNRLELEGLLKKREFLILKSGIRHSFKRIILLPAYLAGSLLFYRKILAGILWDITGFASYIIAKKNN